MNIEHHLEKSLLTKLLNQQIRRFFFDEEEKNQFALVLRKLEESEASAAMDEKVQQIESLIAVIKNHIGLDNHRNALRLIVVLRRLCKMCEKDLHELPSSSSR